MFSLDIFTGQINQFSRLMSLHDQVKGDMISQWNLMRWYVNYVSITSIKCQLQSQYYDF